MSHLQNCCLKIYLKRALGGGGGSGWGVRMDVNEELSFCENSKKKKNFFLGGVGGSGRVGEGGRVGGVRVDVNSEVKFL